MKRGNLAIQIVLLFCGVLVAYFGIFHWIESRRVSKAPWVITFNASGAHPQLEISQPDLNLQSVTIQFMDVTAPSNSLERITFNQPRNPPYPVPFGRCVFQDLLFLPGTVTLELFGHEIQMLPRTLTIDHIERPWSNGAVIPLSTVRTNA